MDILQELNSVEIPRKYPLGLEGMKRKYHDKHVVEIDYDGHPSATLLEFIRRYKDRCLILDSVLASKDVYAKIYQDILDMFKWGFRYDDIRKMPIYFKIHDDDEVIHKIEAQKFLSNMILWFGFIDSDTVDRMTEEDIFIFSEDKSQNHVNDFINERIIPLFGDDYMSANACIAEMSFHMSSLARAFGLIIGLGISCYNIIQSEKTNPIIHDIMYEKLSDDLTPHEIEEMMRERTAKLMKAFCDTDSDLRPLFMAGKNINPNQFKETFITIGYKADTNGNTIPYVIDASILVDGIRKPSHYYILAISGRKSLILTKVSMSDPGSFSKRVIDNTTGVILDPDPNYECDSETYVTYEIEDKRWLKTLNGRYYKDENGEIKCLDYKKDAHLIGKKVPFKSPCTCSDPNGICHKCYGKLYGLNSDLSSAGAFAAVKASEPIGQAILGSKHSQETNSVPILFSNSFGELFELSSAEVSLREDSDNEETNTDEWSILFDDVIIEESEDVDDYYIISFKIINETTGEIITIEEDNGSRMHMTDELIRIYKALRNKNKPIPVSELENSVSVLFNVEVKNSELTEPLRVLNTVLDTNNHGGANSIDEICQATADFYLNNLGKEYDLVHFEMIVRALLRKKSNIMEYPDFSKNGDPDDYQILSIRSSLFNNPSATTSMLYGYLRKQFKGPDFWKKTAPGHTDAMFAPRLYDVIDHDDEPEDDVEWLDEE